MSINNKEVMIKKKSFIKFLLIELETNKNSCELTRLLQRKATVKALIKKQKKVVKALKKRYEEALNLWKDTGSNRIDFENVQECINTYHDFNNPLLALKLMKREIDDKVNHLIEETISNVKHNIDYNAED